MSNIHRKPLTATIPRQVRQLAKLHESQRKRAARRLLPWSRMTDQARAIALRVIDEGREAFK